MNAHTPPPTADISILTVEDRINTAMNAMLLAHDFVEEFCNSFAHRAADAEAANTASYAIGHARETMRRAYEIFHAYQAQEFLKRENAA